MQEELQIEIENVFDEDGFYEQGKSKDEFFIWALEEDGVMTISGYDRMADYGGAKRQSPPWYPYRDKIRCLIVDEGITELGVGAFKDCTALESVMLPDSMTKLGYRCFDGCTSLREVILPPETVFSHVYESEALRFFFTAGRKITMGLHCFRGTPWAQAEWGDFYIREGVLMDYNDTKKNVEIPEGVRSIYKLAFEKCGIQRVTLHEGLETIRASAFDGNQLSAVEIPQSVTCVETGAFANNPSLIRMTTPATDFTLQKNALHSTPIAAFYTEKRDMLLAAEAQKQANAKKAAEEAGKPYKKPSKLPASILSVPEPREDITAFPPAFRLAATKYRHAPEFSLLTLRETEQMLSADEFLTGSMLLPKLKRGQVVIRVTADTAKRLLTEISVLHYHKEVPEASAEENTGKKPKKPKPIEEIYREIYLPFTEDKRVTVDTLPVVKYYKGVADFCSQVRASSGTLCMEADTVADAPKGKTESWFVTDYCDASTLTQLAEGWLRGHAGYRAQSKDAADARRDELDPI